MEQDKPKQQRFYNQAALQQMHQRAPPPSAPMSAPQGVPSSVQSSNVFSRSSSSKKKKSKSSSNKRRDLNFQEEKGYQHQLEEPVPEAFVGAVLDNPDAPDFDLGMDGAFTDFSVLVGLFYSECFNLWTQNAGAALKKKGFRTKAFGTGQEMAFVTELNGGEYDVAWIVSNNSFSGDQEKFKQAVVNFHKTGKGLMIWGDNEPYYVHANLVLPDLCGCKLFGNDSGEQLLIYGNPEEQQRFDMNHLIFAGINTLYEGHTICHPEPPNGNGKLKTIATNSALNPAISCVESYGEEGDDSLDRGGRLIVDNGFTKLYLSWTSKGQARYVVNASVWLVDCERRFGENILPDLP